MYMREKVSHYTTLRDAKQIYGDITARIDRQKKGVFAGAPVISSVEAQEAYVEQTAEVVAHIRKVKAHIQFANPHMRAAVESINALIDDVETNPTHYDFTREDGTAYRELRSALAQIPVIDELQTQQRLHGEKLPEIHKEA